MNASPSTPLIIGVGNEFRGDDGVGIIVARRLRAQTPANVTILEASGEGAALMEAWEGAALVLLIDATRSGSPPGTIHRFDAHAEPLPSRFFHYSTHAFSVAEAVELARALDQLPPRLIVYGIEGKNYTAGEGLSPEVEKAADSVIPRVLQDAGVSAD
jgi:hydrogenase maturation protease